MKKLSLKKTTLSRLNNNALNNVKGGIKLPSDVSRMLGGCNYTEIDCFQSVGMCISGICGTNETLRDCTSDCPALP